MTSSKLLIEAAQLLSQGRELQNNINNETTNTKSDKENKTIMSIDTANHPVLTPDKASELYNSGRTVWEIAQGFGLSYAKARKILAASGTPVRGASARLKGRTRKPASTPVSTNA